MPTQGLLYAQLGIESGLKQMNFRLSQKFTFGSNTSMKLFGSFMDGTTPRCRVQVRGIARIRRPDPDRRNMLRGCRLTGAWGAWGEQVAHKDHFRPAGLRVNCRLRYDVRKAFLKSSVSLKKKVPVNDSCNLNIKLEAVGRVTNVRPFGPWATGKTRPQRLACLHRGGHPRSCTGPPLACRGPSQSQLYLARARIPIPDHCATKCATGRP